MTETQTITGRVLDKHSPREIAEAIEIMIDVLDLIGGDPELEDDDPGETVGDEQDVGLPEWPGPRGFVTTPHGATEDDEEDDPAEANGDEKDHNYAEDDFCAHYGSGPGCPISDPDSAVDDRPCDAECEDGI